MLVAAVGVVAFVLWTMAVPLLLHWILAVGLRTEASVEQLHQARPAPSPPKPARLKAQIGYRPPAPPESGEKGPP